MIVRDEAAVIGRCLRSVLPLIDTWTICDTGSRDATPEIVTRTLAELPGALHRRTWRDFGTNRTELMELAYGTADYLLLLDADMTLHSFGGLPVLTVDAYLLRHAGSLDYAVPRLVRGEIRWRFVGSTHEHLAADEDFTQQELRQLSVEHHADGGRRDEKLERDRRLLELDLERDPDDARALFYLAQTCRDAGERERAIELYRRRAELGGWSQESFYAALQAGILRSEGGREELPQALRLLEHAHALRPQRAEALCELARVHRVLGEYERAYDAARRGMALPYSEDVLFVHRDVHEWRLLFELSIAAHWVGRPREALEATAKLLADGRLPAELTPTVIGNRSYSIASLGGAGGEDRPFLRLDELVGAVSWGAVQLDVEPPWPCCNPSVAADPSGGFMMVVRTVNYLIGRDGYQMLDGDSTIRTLNYLVALDESLVAAEVQPLRDLGAGPPIHPSRIRGFEDCRLVHHDGRWYALACVRDRSPESRCEIALLAIDDGAIERVQMLRGVSARHEKNWAPFVEQEGLAPPGSPRELSLLYTAAPTVVLGCDLATGALRTFGEHGAPAFSTGLRGGSQGVPVPGGHLFVLHEVLPGEALGRRYVHRFALVDRELRLAALSPRFSFTGADLEFCAGLARRGGDLVLSFGAWDRSARLAVVDRDRVLATLEPLDSPAGAGRELALCPTPAEGTRNPKAR